MTNEEFVEWADEDLIKFSWTGSVDNLLLWVGRLNMVAKRVKSMDPGAVIKIDTENTGVSIFCSEKIFYDMGENLPTVG